MGSQTRRYGYFLTIFIAIHSLALQANATRYNINDLRALHIENSYGEFFMHALDIRPSERKGEWSAMLEDMGLKFTKKLQADKSISKKDEALILKISKWSYFKNNELFIQKRDKTLIKILSQCFEQESEDCHKKSQDYFNNYQHEYSFSFELIKVLNHNKTPNPVLWTYVKKFAESKYSEFYCHKTPLKELLSEKILIRAWKEQPPLKIHKDCFNKLVPEFKLALTSNDKQYRTAAYSILKQKGKLAQKDFAKYYLLEYLDDNLKSTETIDKALSELSSLSLNSKLRDEITNTFRSSDLLPGKIFRNNKLSQAKTRILYRNFPEYIDLYAKTCLNYLDGSKSFPRGNPTPDCHHFFSMNKEMNILPTHFSKNYNKATSFLNNK